MRESHARALSLLALGLLALIWGTQFLIIKAGQATLPPLFAAAARFAIVAVLSQLIVSVKGYSAPPGRLGARLLFGVAQAISMGTLYWAEPHVPSAVAALLAGTEPFLVAAMAHYAVVGERLTLRAVLALGLGFIGFSLMATGTSSGAGSHHAEVLAVLVLLLGCVAGATNKVVGKRLALGLPAPVAMRDMGLIVAVLLGSASLLFERDVPIVASSRTWLTLLYLAVVASTGASTTYFVLLRRFPVTALAYLQFGTALVATLTGVLVGQEHLSPVVGVGAGAILAGLVVLGTRRSSPAVSTATAR